MKKLILTSIAIAAGAGAVLGDVMIKTSGVKCMVEVLSIREGKASIINNDNDDQQELVPLSDIQSLEIIRAPGVVSGDIMTLASGQKIMVNLLSLRGGKASLINRENAQRAELVPLINIQSLEIIRAKPQAVSTVVPTETRDPVRSTKARNSEAQDTGGNTFDNVTDFKNNMAQYFGQRVTVRGVVSDAKRGIDFDWYLLEGKLRCRFRRGSHCTEGDSRETRRTVSITGTVVRPGVTATPDLVDCDCPDAMGTESMHRVKIRKY